jgi:CRP-like cAMP-binding protein
VVATTTSRLSALHLVVDGRLEATEKLRTQSTWEPRQVFGVLEVIAGRPVAAPVIAAVETHTLQLGAGDLAEVLEDNFGLLSNARRGIARHLLSSKLRRGAAGTWLRPSQVVVPHPHPGLVERLIVLRQQLPFARMPALAALAQAALEVTVEAGEVIREAGAHSDGAFIVLDGMVRGRAEHVLVPNDSIGLLETVAERGHAMSTTAITRTRLLRVPAMALFDVMEDHTDLALGMITRLAGEVLDQAGEPDDVN